MSDVNAQLADPTPEALADGLLMLLRDSELHARKVAAGLVFAKSTDVVTEMKRVESAFYQGLKIPATTVGRAKGAT